MQVYYCIERGRERWWYTVGSLQSPPRVLPRRMPNYRRLEWEGVVMFIPKGYVQVMNRYPPWAFDVLFHMRVGNLFVRSNGEDDDIIPIMGFETVLLYLHILFAQGYRVASASEHQLRLICAQPTYWNCCWCYDLVKDERPLRMRLGHMNAVPADQMPPENASSSFLSRHTWMYQGRVSHDDFIRADGFRDQFKKSE